MPKPGDVRAMRVPHRAGCEATLDDSSAQFRRARAALVETMLDLFEALFFVITFVLAIIPLYYLFHRLGFTKLLLADRQTAKMAWSMAGMFGGGAFIASHMLTEPVMEMLR
jgi:hypothetical protein